MRQERNLHYLDLKKDDIRQLIHARNLERLKRLAREIQRETQAQGCREKLTTVQHDIANFSGYRCWQALAASLEKPAASAASPPDRGFRKIDLGILLIKELTSYRDVDELSAACFAAASPQLKEYGRRLLRLIWRFEQTHEHESTRHGFVGLLLEYFKPEEIGEALKAEACADWVEERSLLKEIEGVSHRLSAIAKDFFWAYRNLTLDGYHALPREEIRHRLLVDGTPAAQSRQLTELIKADIRAGHGIVLFLTGSGNRLLTTTYDSCAAAGRLADLFFYDERLPDELNSLGRNYRHTFPRDHPDLIHMVTTLRKVVVLRVDIPTASMDGWANNKKAHDFMGRLMDWNSRYGGPRDALATVYVEKADRVLYQGLDQLFSYHHNKLQVTCACRNVKGLRAAVGSGLTDTILERSDCCKA